VPDLPGGIGGRQCADEAEENCGFGQKTANKDIIDLAKSVRTNEQSLDEPLK